MKKIILIFLIIAFGKLSFAQNIRILYEAINITEKDSIINYYNLDIYKNKSYFYESSLLSSDSLFTTTNSIVEKDKINNRVKIYDKFDDVLFNYSENNELKYTFKKESKKSGNLIEAKLNAFNDNWIIEFSNESNIVDGPYKFWGVPGLIYNIYNENKTFIISLIEIKKNTEQIDFKNLKISKEISKKKFLDTKTNYDSNIFLLNEFSKFKIDNSDLKNIEKMLKSSSRKNVFKDLN